MKYDLKLAIRNLKRNQSVSAINIFGLMIGFTFVILAGRYVFTESTFDKFHTNHQSIYRIERSEPGSGVTCMSPNVMHSWLNANIPEIQNVTRILNDGGFGKDRNLIYQQNKYNLEKPLIVDSDFFAIFSFQLLSGELNSFENDKYSIVLNETLARKIFGEENAIGKIIQYKNMNFTVKAVLKQPVNSSIHFDILLPAANLPGYAQDLNWRNCTMHTFILARTTFAGPALQKIIQNGIMSHLQTMPFYEYVKNWQYQLNPLTDIYYSGYEFPDNICIHGNRRLTWFILFLAAVILFVALLNYINIGLGTAFERGKTIGVMRIIGARKADAIRLLVVESLLAFFIANLLALELSHLLEPFINPLLNVPLIEMGPGSSIVVLLGGLTAGAATGLILGAKLSSAKTNSLVRSRYKKSAQSMNFKGSLSIIQFAASIVLLISVLGIYSQLDFVFKQKSENFDEDLVLYLPLANRTQEKQSKIFTLQKILKSLPEVTEVSSSLHLPGDEFYSNLAVLFKNGSEEEREIRVNHNMVDLSYPEALGFEIVRGRSFQPDIQSDTGGYLVNETFINTYNINDLTEAAINGSPIIGVVKDFHYNSLHQKIAPLAIRYENSYQSHIVLRLDSASTGSLASVVDKIRQTCDSVDATAISDIRFLDQHLAALYEKEIKISKILFWLAMFSILISCLGLFSISLFLIKSRTKEIGIRKVLGSTVSGIIFLLSGKFVKWVLLANSVAWPLAWFVMNKWLQNFAYRIDIAWWMFVLPGALALGIALLTVGWQAVRAALANPVEALRYE